MSGATATATLAPSNTPEPTFTPSATQTSTPSPTATPDAAATAAFRATQTANEVLRDLDKVLGDTDIPYRDGHLVWQQEKSIAINMSGPDQGLMGIGDSVTADNFILKFDVTWEATGLLICGAIFRSEPSLEKGKQYQFVFMRFSGLPAWAIEVHEFGQFRNTPSDVRFSDALNLGNGAANQFMLVAQEEQFTLYINSVRQGRFFDYSKQRSHGLIGFLGAQQSGKGSCEFEDSWVWALE